jgi:hypothetical protein
MKHGRAGPWQTTINTEHVCEDLEEQLRTIRALTPGGAEGLFGPASVMWRVDREAAIFLGRWPRPTAPVGPPLGSGSHLRTLTDIRRPCRSLSSDVRSGFWHGLRIARPSRCRGPSSASTPRCHSGLSPSGGKLRSFSIQTSPVALIGRLLSNIRSPAFGCASAP